MQMAHGTVIHPRQLRGITPGICHPVLDQIHEACPLAMPGRAADSHHQMFAMPAGQGRAQCFGLQSVNHTVVLE